jgi:hypothetical protein
MVQPKKRKRSKSVDPQYVATINMRVPRELKESLTEIAKLDRRRLRDYLIIHLEQHVKECTVTDNAGMHDQTGPYLRTVLPGGIAGTSEPPARIKQQAAAHVKTAAPLDKLVEIAESEEGWEGSDPRKLLAGTKT